MSPEKYLELSCEVFCMGNFFNVVPPDFPFRRELILQNNNLQRVLSQRPSEAEFQIGSGSAKKFIKRRGQHDAEIGKRIRTLRSLFEKSRREWLRKLDSIEGQPYSRRQFGIWNTQFKKIVSNSVQDVKKKFVDSRRALKHAGS